jgi:hypothetical protein
MKYTGIKKQGAISEISKVCLCDYFVFVGQIKQPLIVIADKVVTEGNVSLWFSGELDNYYYSILLGVKKGQIPSTKLVFISKLHGKHFS